MPYFSFMIAIPLFYADKFLSFWRPILPPGGVNSEKKAD